MKKVLFLTLISLFYLSDSVAKEIVLTVEDLNCSSAADYCADSKGQPFTGKLSLHAGGGKVLRNFKNGRWSGLTTVWDENGRLQSKTYYKEGQKNGLERIFYENRTVKSSAEYKDGKLNGRVDYYTRKGKLKGRLNYKAGRFENGYCLNNGKKQNIGAEKAGTFEQISCGEE